MNESAKCENVKWMSFERAVAEAALHVDKMMFIYVYADWSAPCRIMNERTVNDPKVAKIVNEKFFPVKFNAEGNECISFLGKSYENKGFNASLSNSQNSIHPFTSYLATAVNGVVYPTCSFLSHDGREKHPIQGVIEVEEFSLMLYYIADGAYKRKIDFQSFKQQNKYRIQL
jgi:thioredoxin-related protein